LESTLGERTDAIKYDSVKTAGEPTVGERIPPPRIWGDKMSGLKTWNKLLNFIFIFFLPTVGLKINGASANGFSTFGDRTYGVNLINYNLNYSKFMSYLDILLRLESVNFLPKNLNSFTEKSQAFLEK
jgi:hypothetical protein